MSTDISKLKRLAGISGQYKATITEKVDVIEENRTGFAKKVEQAMNVTRNIRVNRIALTDQDWQNLGAGVNLNAAMMSLLNSAKNQEDATKLVQTYIARKYPKAARNQNVMQVLNTMIEVTFNG